MGLVADRTIAPGPDDQAHTRRLALYPIYLPHLRE